jgi:diguanylate cyclase (GGDEF)-like protein
VLGTVNLYDVVPDAFSDHAICVLTSVAQQAALAINNAYAFEQARDSAMRDPLTNLHNGRYLRRCLDQETSRAARLGDWVSVLAIDLDNFKNVNDTYGHQGGDRVLKDITDIFRVQLREYDVAVRTGGDEFVVVLPETPYSEAVRTADRIRDAIESYAQTEIGKECVGLGASVGVGSFPQDATDPEILLFKADQAMYADKHARKHRNHAA